MPVTGEAVTLILATIDRIKILLEELERHQAECAGDDRDLIAQLDRMSGAASVDLPAVDELERAIPRAPEPGEHSERPRNAQPAVAPRDDKIAAPVGRPENAGAPEERSDSRIANQSIRVMSTRSSS